MSVAHLSVFVPHTPLEKWRVEKEHKNNKENVVSWFPFFFTFLELSFFVTSVSVLVAFIISLALECSLQAGVQRTISRCVCFSCGGMKKCRTQLDARDPPLLPQDLLTAGSSSKSLPDATTAG